MLNLGINILDLVQEIPDTDSTYHLSAENNLPRSMLVWRLAKDIQIYIHNLLNHLTDRDTYEKEYHIRIIIANITNH